MNGCIATRCIQRLPSARCSCTGSRGWTLNPALPWTLEPLEPCSPFSHGKAGPEPHNPLDWPERGLTALSQRWPLPLPPWRPGAAPLESPPKWTSGTLEQKQDPNELQSTIVRFLLWDFKSDLNLQSRTFILHVSHMVSFVFLSNYIVKHRETYPELQKTEQWNCAPVNHQPLAFSKLHSVFQQHSLHT